MAENVRDILARYGVKTPVAMPERDARSLACEMAGLAVSQNLVGENHLAVGALTYAVLALATEAPAPSDAEMEYRRRWESLAAWLQEAYISYRRLAKAHADDRDYHVADMYHERAMGFERVIRMMGEDADDSADASVDSVSELLRRFQDDPAGPEPDAGDADKGV
jgi:hypothetical protein